ncbi:MAG: hypothetical protein ACRDSR_20610 [Pseudonocardiaceae bacterium]
MLSHDDLAARAGVHPWQLRDDLADGDPGEISQMASAWARAGGHAADADAFAQEASQRTADSYTVNGAAVRDSAAGVAETNRQLSLGGDAMGRVAKLLDGISDRLTESTTKAQAQVSALEGELQKIDERLLQTASTTPPKEQESARNGLIDEAVQAVRRHGGTIRTEVESYEDFLAQNLRSLADLGLVPPDPIDFGPGDINSTDSGSQAAGSTVSAAKANNAEGVEDATRYLDLLNHKRQSGADLTDAETAYLRDYYNTLTPHLPEIKKWADQANCTTGAEDDMAPNLGQRETQLASRVADGLLTLSHEVPYDQLPQPVRSIIDGDIGVVDPRYSDEGGRLPGSYPPKGDDNLRRYAGFMDFMDDYASANAKPSNDLAQHLGDSAIRWKQQINVMAQNYGEHIEAANHYHAGPLDSNDAKPPSPEEWAGLFPDELSSDALGLVGRNAQFSNQWITGDHADRRALMGMNWQHGSGAAEVILAGTLPSNQPDDTVSAPDATNGALAVVRDASADYIQLARTANSDVKAAIGVMGSAYVDSFAQDPGEAPGQPGVGQFELPNGQQTWGMTLDQGTHANFLKFLAASDGDVYGNFRAQADGRAAWYVEQAVRAGHTDPGDPAYQQALSAGMRLHGSLDGASAGVLKDMASAGASADQQRLMAEEQAHARAVADYQGAKSLTDGAMLVADVVGLAPGATGTAASASKIVLEQLTDTFLKEPEEPGWGSHITNLQGYIVNLAESQTVTAEANATMTDDMAHIIARGHQDAGTPATDPATGQPVVPDPDGDMPESYRDSVYDSVSPSLRIRGSEAMNAVISNRPGSGSGYHQQWATGTAGQVGSLNDAGGNWSNEDDRYRIFCGDEKRIDYQPAGWFHGSEWKAEIPDGKLKTKTDPVDPDRLPSVR